jgi:Xaa-Pro aminopeptidase
MNSPTERPTIPAAEYRARWARVQELMAGHKLDFLLAYADDRAVAGPAHVRWLAGFPVHFEPACVLIPREGEPVLLCGPESDQYALLSGSIPDVRVLRAFTHPDEDYPFSRIQSLNEIMADLLGGSTRARRGRVGLAGGSLVPFETMSAFRGALPEAAWVDVEGAVSELRAQKSPAEIAVTRHAYRIAELGLLAGLEAIEPGVTERAVAAEIEAAMRRAGSEGNGIDTIVASGPNSRPILARSTFRQIAANDGVLLTVAPRYEGYHAALGRLLLLGDPGEAIGSALQVAVRAQEACASALRPGIEGREVEAIGRRVVSKAGLGSHFLYSGVHSVGVVEFEPPIFGPSSPAQLRENMIISIDIPIFNTPWGGLRIEDGYLITDRDAERLSNIPYTLDRLR